MQELSWGFYRHPPHLLTILFKEIAMDLYLDDKEAALAYRVLRNRLEEIRTEVRHDKDSEAREYLKHKEHILNDILAKFSGVDEEAHKKAFFDTTKK
jgi:hypothetical protein